MLDILKTFSQRGYSTLVSGGAAWADHLAVTAFLDGSFDRLVLYGPCEWDDIAIRFEDRDDGRIANHYHSSFSRKIGHDTLKDINEAIARGAVYVPGKGFKERNSSVAAGVDGLLAFTFGSGSRVAEGGTADTCRKYLSGTGPMFPNMSYHVDLNTMILHEGITAS